MRNKRSQEDYLSAILALSKRNLLVRSVDIANYMGFSKASVCRAIGRLIQFGFALMDENKRIYLTVEGRRKAELVDEKFHYFKNMLLEVGVDEPTASMEACRIEHAIGDAAFKAIKEGAKRESSE